MHKIVVIGSAGHAKVVLDILELCEKYKVVGLIDSFKKSGEKVNGYEVLGDEFILPDLCQNNNVFGGIVAIGHNWNRNSMIDKIKKMCPEFNFIIAVHPQAVVGSHVKIGDGTVVMAGAIVNSNSSIGNHCIINTQSIIEHDSTISSFASIAPGAILGGNVSVGSKTAVGIGATVIEKINIGKGSIIGAHSLVLRDVPSDQIWYGVPAEYKKEVDPIVNYLK